MHTMIALSRIAEIILKKKVLLFSAADFRGDFFSNSVKRERVKKGGLEIALAENLA